VNEGLLDPFRHNAWATRELLRTCRDLSPEQLDATATGTFGTIRETLAHVVRAERFYRSLLDAAPEWGRPDGATPLDVLEERAGDMAAFWESFLSRPIDTERVVVDENETETTRVAAGVLIAQVLNHGNEHRGHVCTILTTLGIPPPELDGWAYGEAVGRATVEPSSP